MNKKRLSIILTIFFLVQGVSASQISSAETLLLNPHTRVSLNDSQFSIKPLCEAILTGLFIYKLNVTKGYTEKEIEKEFGEFILRSQGVQFDLRNLDLGKKVFRKGGFTRYYPFKAAEKDFILRIFLYSERYYQSRLPVLYEGRTSNNKLVFQILPGVNELIEDCEIKPYNPPAGSLVDSSS